MPARTGLEYVAGLKQRAAEVYIAGERVKDVTSHPALGNAVHTLASLYDMQHDPGLMDEMTYVSPSTGDRVGLSFIIPRTIPELERRRRMMAHWARAGCGMMGRTPDFLNISIMTMAAAGDYFAQNRPEFKDNIQRYYEHIREKDLVLTHTLVNLQRNRSPPPPPPPPPPPLAAPLDDRTDVALSVTRETDAGIVVRGSRVLATLGPLSDEIVVYPARSHRLPGSSLERYSFAFAIPCDTPGLKFLCREALDLGRSHFDHPLASRFEEMDAIVFFDDVLVPWERVFLLGDVELCNNLSTATNQYTQSGHQVVTKNVVKCEFILGLANLMVRTLGSGELPQAQQMVAEIIENLEVTRACLRAAEADAQIDRWGVMCPSPFPLMVARTCSSGSTPGGGGPPPPGVQQPHGPPRRGRPPGTPGSGGGPLHGDGQRLGQGAYQAVPTGMGRVLQRLRNPPGTVRALLPGGLHTERPDPVCPVRQRAGD